jgi:iron(III) transport system permease protein
VTTITPPVTTPDNTGVVTVVGRNKPPAWWVGLGVLSLFAAAVPLVYLVVRVGELPIQGIFEILARPRVGQLLWNTVGLGFAVSVTAVVMGVLIAIALTRAEFTVNRFWLVASALPLAVPSYLASYGWLVVWPSLSGFWPSFILLTAVTVPYVALPVAARMRGLAGDHEKVARTLGLGPIAAFYRSTWPQLRPAALAGGLLVFLYTISDFGLVAMLRFQTLTWGINAAYSAAFDRSQAAVLALLLVVLALIAVIGERRARAVTDVSRGRSKHLGPPLAPIYRRVLLTIVTLPPLIGVVIPLTGMSVRLFQADTIRQMDVARLAEATGWTVLVALSAAVAAVLLALPIAALAARYRTGSARLLESAAYLSHGLPGIVVGLSLVFLGIRLVPALYQTTILLVFAYAVLFMSKALGTTRSAIEGVSPDLIRVARSLGQSAFGAWRRVTLPLAMPGIAIGALLVAIATMKELPATLLLRPTGMNTLATELWTRTVILEYGAAAPYAAVLVAVAAIPAMLLSGIRAEKEVQR